MSNEQYGNRAPYGPRHGNDNNYNRQYRQGTGGRGSNLYGRGPGRGQGWGGGRGDSYNDTRNNQYDGNVVQPQYQHNMHPPDNMANFNGNNGPDNLQYNGGYRGGFNQQHHEEYYQSQWDAAQPPYSGGYDGGNYGNQQYYNGKPNLEELNIQNGEFQYQKGRAPKKQIDRSRPLGPGDYKKKFSNTPKRDKDDASKKDEEQTKSKDEGVDGPAGEVPKNEEEKPKIKESLTNDNRDQESVKAGSDTKKGKESKNKWADMQEEEEEEERREEEERIAKENVDSKKEDSKGLGSYTSGTAKPKNNKSLRKGNDKGRKDPVPKQKTGGNTTNQKNAPKKEPLTPRQLRNMERNRSKKEKRKADVKAKKEKKEKLVEKVNTLIVSKDSVTWTSLGQASSGVETLPVALSLAFAQVMSKGKDSLEFISEEVVKEYLGGCRKNLLLKIINDDQTAAVTAAKIAEGTHHMVTGMSPPSSFPELLDSLNKELLEAGECTKLVGAKMLEVWAERYLEGGSGQVKELIEIEILDLEEEQVSELAQKPGKFLKYLREKGVEVTFQKPSFAKLRGLKTRRTSPTTELDSSDGDDAGSKGKGGDDVVNNGNKDAEDDAQGTGLEGAEEEEEKSEVDDKLHEEYSVTIRGIPPEANPSTFFARVTIPGNPSTKKRQTLKEMILKSEYKDCYGSMNPSPFTEVKSESLNGMYILNCYGQKFEQMSVAFDQLQSCIADLLKPHVSNTIMEFWEISPNRTRLDEEEPEDEGRNHPVGEEGEEVVNDGSEMVVLKNGVESSRISLNNTTSSNPIKITYTPAKPDQRFQSLRPAEDMKYEESAAWKKGEEAKRSILLSRLPAYLETFLASSQASFALASLSNLSSSDLQATMEPNSFQRFLTNLHVTPMKFTYGPKGAAQGGSNALYKVQVRIKSIDPDGFQWADSEMEGKPTNSSKFKGLGDIVSSYTQGQVAVHNAHNHKFLVIKADPSGDFEKDEKLGEPNDPEQWHPDNCARFADRHGMTNEGRGPGISWVAITVVSSNEGVAGNKSLPPLRGGKYDKATDERKEMEKRGERHFQDSDRSVYGHYPIVMCVNSLKDEDRAMIKKELVQRAKEMGKVIRHSDFVITYVEVKCDKKDKIHVLAAVAHPDKAQMVREALAVVNEETEGNSALVTRGYSMYSTKHDTVEEKELMKKGMEEQRAYEGSLSYVEITSIPPDANPLSIIPARSHRAGENTPNNLSFQSVYELMLKGPFENSKGEITQSVVSKITRVQARWRLYGPKPRVNELYAYAYALAFSALPSYLSSFNHVRLPTVVDNRGTTQATALANPQQAAAAEPQQREVRVAPRPAPSAVLPRSRRKVPRSKESVKEKESVASTVTPAKPPEEATESALVAKLKSELPNMANSRWDSPRFDGSVNSPQQQLNKVDDLEEIDRLKLQLKTKEEEVESLKKDLTDSHSEVQGLRDKLERPETSIGTQTTAPISEVVDTSGMVSLASTLTKESQKTRATVKEEVSKFLTLVDDVSIRHDREMSELNITVIHLLKECNERIAEESDKSKKAHNMVTFLQTTTERLMEENSRLNRRLDAMHMQKYLDNPLPSKKDDETTGTSAMFACFNKAVSTALSDLQRASDEVDDKLAKLVKKNDDDEEEEDRNEGEGQKDSSDGPEGDNKEEEPKEDSDTNMAVVDKSANLGEDEKAGEEGEANEEDDIKRLCALMGWAQRDFESNALIPGATFKEAGFDQAALQLLNASPAILVQSHWLQTVISKGILELDYTPVFPEVQFIPANAYLNRNIIPDSVKRDILDNQGFGNLSVVCISLSEEEGGGRVYTVISLFPEPGDFDELDAISQGGMVEELANIVFRCEKGRRKFFRPSFEAWMKRHGGFEGEEESKDLPSIQNPPETIRTVHTQNGSIYADRSYMPSEDLKSKLRTTESPVPEEDTDDEPVNTSSQGTGKRLKGQVRWEVEQKEKAVLERVLEQSKREDYIIHNFDNFVPKYPDQKEEKEKESADETATVVDEENDELDTDATDGRQQARPPSSNATRHDSNPRPEGSPPTFPPSGTGGVSDKHETQGNETDRDVNDTEDDEKAQCSYCKSSSGVMYQCEGENCDNMSCGECLQGKTDPIECSFCNRRRNIDVLELDSSSSESSVEYEENNENPSPGGQAVNNNGDDISESDPPSVDSDRKDEDYPQPKLTKKTTTRTENENEFSIGTGQPIRDPSRPRRRVIKRRQMNITKLGS